MFDLTGKLIAASRRPIQTWHEPGGIVEQSSADIWTACGAAIGDAIVEAHVSAAAVRGVSFDATCSLVVLDAAGQSLAVGSTGPTRDVIVWMDHRAVMEARVINQGKHAVLRYVGGSISPEMQTPKIRWLKSHAPDTYAAAAHFFDLSDFLTFKATGSTARSLCTVTCKWTYLAHERRWDEDFFRAIGLEELTGAAGRARIGDVIVAPGTPLGNGLTAAAAAELHLLEGTPVGASLIDAHAGAVGTVGGGANASGRIAYIMGTSACIMASTATPAFVQGKSHVR